MTMDGKRLYLYAADQEASEQEGESWCGGIKGETAYKGHYSWYLEPARESPLVPQPAQVGDSSGLLEFGGGKKRLTALSLGEQTYALVFQYSNCNMETFQLFGLDESGTLKRFPFKFAEGTVTETPGTSGEVGVKENRLQTSFYDRDGPKGGGWIFRSWALKEGAFVEVKTERQEPK